MSLYDEFIPNPEIKCPKCSGTVRGWQGKPETGCALFVWKQGAKHPIGQSCDDDFKISQKELEAFTLPSQFSIWGGECMNCGFNLSYSEYSFYGRCTNDVWSETLFEPYFKAKKTSENWYECEKCQNIWESSINKTHDHCPSCGIFCELTFKC